MTFNGWTQIAVYFAVLTSLVVPLGRYMARVFEGEPTSLSPVLRPVETFLYRIAGIDETREQHWTSYTLAMLLFNAAGFLLLYAILRMQAWLPINPQSMSGMPGDLAFNTAVSFTTNTNWQNYGGESTLSYLSQMLGITTQNFVSAATGVALVIALVRAFARASAGTVGNFWVDLTRCTLYVLLPLSAVAALVLVWQGVPQNLGAYVDATTLEGAKQTLSQGPAASQIAIKQLGTNGGGFWNANGSVPYENPTPLSNLLEMLYIVLIPAALTCTFGRMVRDERQGWALYAAMAIVFLAGVAITYWAEASGNPQFAALGLDPASLEGKEIRFGIANSSLWAVATTAASNGSVNAMHDSFTPLGGMIPLILIQLGEVIFGGVGSGLYGMLLFVIIAMFVAGLMVGRTPEYLGKKIEAKEVKMAMLAILVLPLSILGFMALATVVPFGVSSVLNQGPHGFSEIMYLYSSSTGNNGSAFAGLTGNTLWYNTTGGLAMLIGRYFVIVPVMAIAGSLVAKKIAPASAGTFPTHSPLFVGLLVGVILIMGGLTFFPALALGPIAEHFAMLAGQQF
jgi:potassium-transporting ATPase potassium-binding subunit